MQRLTWPYQKKNSNLSSGKSSWWHQGWQYHHSHQKCVTSPGWKLMRAEYHMFSRIVCRKNVTLIIIIIFHYQYYHLLATLSFLIINILMNSKIILNIISIIFIIIFPFSHYHPNFKSLQTDLTSLIKFQICF